MAGGEGVEEAEERDELDGEPEADIVVAGGCRWLKRTGTVTGTVVGEKRRRNSDQHWDVDVDVVGVEEQ